MNATDFYPDNVLVLIDGHAVIYRAYYAFPELTTPQGKLANAVYGFTRILLSSIRDFDPDYIAVAFDHPKKTFRHDDFEDYKAHREEMPDDLKPQIEMIKQVVTALNIPQFEIAGYEADDLIGTLAGQSFEYDNLETIIVTGDKDVLQLVDRETKVFIPGRGKYSVDTEYDIEKVKQKMGVPPNRVADLKALMGDSSDNIPGVKGVGEKTALKLLNTFDNLEAVYQQVDQLVAAESEGELIKGALLKRLVRDKEQAFLSYQLATIDTNVPLDFSLEDCKLSGYDKQEVLDVFDELGFHSLQKMLPPDDFELGVKDALL